MNRIEYRRRPRAGFTLIELLVVITIIGIMAGMLLPALAAVRNRARKVQALSEVKGLALAWQQYYEEYVLWPSFADEMAAVKIDGPIADVLQGKKSTPPNSDNRRSLPFMNFSKLNADGEPVNPWARSEYHAANTPTNHYYYAKFDTDFDDAIKVGAANEPPFSNAVQRSVIVWTYDDDNEVLGSWQK